MIRIDWAASSPAWTTSAVAAGAGTGSALLNGRFASATVPSTTLHMKPVGLIRLFGSGPLPSRGASQSFIASIVRLARLRLWRMRYCVWKNSSLNQPSCDWNIWSSRATVGASFSTSSWASLR